MDERWNSWENAHESEIDELHLVHATHFPVLNLYFPAGKLFFLKRLTVSNHESFRPLSLFCPLSISLSPRKNKWSRRQLETFLLNCPLSHCDKLLSVSHTRTRFLKQAAIRSPKRKKKRRETLFNYLITAASGVKYTRRKSNIVFSSSSSACNPALIDRRAMKATN